MGSAGLLGGLGLRSAEPESMSARTVCATRARRTHTLGGADYANLRCSKVKIY